MTNLHPSTCSDLIGVTTWSAAYDYSHDRYQAYYAAGLREALADRGIVLRTRPLHRMPRALAALRRIRHSYQLSRVMARGGWVLDALAGALTGRQLPPSGRFHALAGQYEFHYRDGQTIRLIVDAQDSGDIADVTLLDRSDVYAKSNYRKDRAYPAHMVPVVNGNPLILPHRSLLRELRRREPVHDVCFVVRVWGGRDEEAGVEHNLRLLEALNRARCRKFLLAYLVAGDVAAQERRLRAQGIATTRKPMPLRDLWEVSARSRLNVIRLGMHNCIPWRFTDMLALGACVVLDQAPQTVWPVPLVSGEHYEDLATATPPAGGVALDADYERIPGQIDLLLSNPARVRRVRDGAAGYFDRHACPPAVGRSLLDSIGSARRKND